MKNHYQDKTQRQQARKKLGEAVAKGVVRKPTHCEACGKETPRMKLHGHHWDYRRPLDVQWLCQYCHSELHKVSDEFYQSLALKNSKKKRKSAKKKDRTHKCQLCGKDFLRGAVIKVNRQTACLKCVGKLIDKELNRPGHQSYLW
jgi:predicted Zn-ribbon and HTH transcriptional regulator